MSSKKAALSFITLFYAVDARRVLLHLFLIFSACGQLISQLSSQCLGDALHLTGFQHFLPAKA